MPRLVTARFEVALVNPLRTRRFAEEELQRTKTDAISRLRPTYWVGRLVLYPVSGQKVHDHNQIGDDESGWHEPTRSAPDPRRHFALLITISDVHCS